MAKSSRSDINTAVAQIPHGLFLITAASEGHRSGVLANWIQQCSSDPPMIMVAMPKGQPIEPLIRDSRHFALCQIGENDRFLRRKFAEPPERGDDPFDSLPTSIAPSGSPVVTQAVCYLDCELVCHLELEADHRLFVGQIHHGGMLDASTPAVFFGTDTAAG